jgi:hypothetical protein
MSKKAKHDHTNGKAHIRKTWEMMRSPAYRDLSATARCLLDELLLRFNGHNNGSIFLEVRQAAKMINCGKNTIARSFYELAEHGFIKLSEESSWQQRKAREWWITCVYQPDGREPTNDWQRWESDNPVFGTPKVKNPLSPIGDRKKPVPQSGTDCPQIGTDPKNLPALVSDQGQRSINQSQTSMT